MTGDLLFSFIILFIFLIGLDILLLRIRKDKGSKKTYLVKIFQQYFDHSLIRLKNIQPFFGKKPRVESSEARLDIPLEVIPGITHSATLQTTTLLQAAPEISSQLMSKPEEAPLPSVNQVRVSITAEIPLGSIVHISISAGIDGVPTVEQKMENHPFRPPSPAIKVPRSTWQLGELANIVSNKLKPILAKFQSFSPKNFSLALFLMAILVYLTTRFTGLVDFPIYFFGDEAVQAVSAADLIAHGWEGAPGQFFTT